MDKELKGSPKKYKILECLNENQNSKVFKVLAIDFLEYENSFMVLKLLESKKQFLDCVHEFNSLKKVSSIHCVKVFTWEWINNQPAFILEYVEGISLKELSGFYNLNSEEIQFVTNGIGKGLMALHNEQLVHGDLSLSNVLIDIHGRVKLIDYGMANIFGKYTPNFVAPEILTNRAYSLQADYYSLGKIIKFLGGKERDYQNLLSENPQLRKFNFKSCNSIAQQSLSKKVRQRMSRKALSPTINQEYPQKKLARGFIVAAFVSLLMGTSAAKDLEPFSKQAFLTVKTQKWAKISINQQDMGYAPLFKKPILAGNVNIRWQGSHAKGEVTLTLKPGEHKVITELKSQQ